MIELDSRNGTAPVANVVLAAKEVWFDLSEDGEATKIRFSVIPSSFFGYGMDEGGTLGVPLAGPSGGIGRAVVRYIATIKGLAILEVVELLPEDAQSRHSWPSLPVISEHRQEGI